MIIMPARNTPEPFYLNLEAEIARIGIKKKDMADKLNLTQKTLSNKLIGKTDFGLKEMFCTLSMLPGTTAEQLFEYKS